MPVIFRTSRSFLLLILAQLILAAPVFAFSPDPQNSTSPYPFSYSTSTSLPEAIYHLQESIRLLRETESSVRTSSTFDTETVILSLEATLVKMKIEASKQH